MTWYRKTVCDPMPPEQDSPNAMPHKNTRGSNAMRWFAWVCFSATQAAAMAQAPDPWPELPPPPHLEQFDVGSTRMELNGVPTRIRGYVSDRSATELSQWYRQNVSGTWVENRIGTKTILGQKRSAHFVTIELEPMLSNASGNHTKVVAASMALRTAKRSNTQRELSLDYWTVHLPVQSQVISHIVDHDQGKASLHMVIVNRHSSTVNKHHFQREFGQMGFVMDPIFSAPSGQQIPPPPRTPAGEKFLFTGAKGEAILVLARDESGRSTAVMNLSIWEAE